MRDWIVDEAEWVGEPVQSSSLPKSNQQHRQQVVNERAGPVNRPKIIDSAASA